MAGRHGVYPPPRPPFPPQPPCPSPSTRGDTGATGPQGSNGEVGPTGPQGIGLTGPTGQIGMNGTAGGVVLFMNVDEVVEVNDVKFYNIDKELYQTCAPIIKNVILDNNINGNRNKSRARIYLAKNY